jgi:hypothetical protein
MFKVKLHMLVVIIVEGMDIDTEKNNTVMLLEQGK